jgi:hypothetical protein
MPQCWWTRETRRASRTAILRVLNEPTLRDALCAQRA